MKKINYNRLLKSVRCSVYPEPVCFGDYTVATDVVRLVVVKQPGTPDVEKTKAWSNGFPKKSAIDAIIDPSPFQHSFKTDADLLFSLIKPVFSDRKLKVVPSFFFEDGSNLCIQYDPTYVRGEDSKAFVKTRSFPYTGDLVRDSFLVTTPEGVTLSSCGCGFNLKFFYDVLKHLSGEISISFRFDGLHPFTVSCQDAVIYIMPIRLI